MGQGWCSHFAQSIAAILHNISRLLTFFTFGLTTRSNEEQSRPVRWTDFKRIHVSICAIFLKTINKIYIVNNDGWYCFVYGFVKHIIDWILLIIVLHYILLQDIIGRGHRNANALAQFPRWQTSSLQITKLRYFHNVHIKDTPK